MTSYSTRHSFAAWSLTIGVNPLRLFGLMGHASKQMVFEVYGNYVEGLEEDAENIIAYFGQDCITPRKNNCPALFRYSTRHSSNDLFRFVRPYSASLGNAWVMFLCCQLATTSGYERSWMFARNIRYSNNLLIL